MLTATALLLVAAWTGYEKSRGRLSDRDYVIALPQRPGMGPPLERHPFSGQVRSVGELLHTP